MVALVVAALGIAGTLGGVWLTQCRADRREDLNWARQETARTYEFRRTAYVDFYQAAVDHGQQTFRYVVDVHIDGEQNREPPGVGTLHEAFDAIQIYGSPRIRELAKKTQTVAYQFRWDAQQPDFDMEMKKRQDDWDAALTHLLDAIREELGVPNDGSSKPVS